VNELFGVVLVHPLCGVLTLQLKLGVHQIGLESLKLIDLCLNVLDLVVNALDEPVMRDGSLSGREHGLFLCEEHVLLVLGEIALKECLGKTEMLKLRMSELSVAEHALGNGYIVATEECLVAGAACGLSACVNGTANVFASVRGECIKAYGAGCIGHIDGVA
jgi:hypothetical protein